MAVAAADRSVRYLRSNAVLIIFVLLALVDQAFADTTFPSFGGKGDFAATDRCPEGSVLVGFKARTGAWFDQIGLICAKLEHGASVVGKQRLYMPPRGGNGGGPNERYCQRGEVVVGLRFKVIEDRTYKQVKYVEFACRPLRSGNPPRKIVMKGDHAGGYEAASPPNDCPADEVAVGLNGRYGKHVNALGLICGSY